MVRMEAKAKAKLLAMAKKAVAVYSEMTGIEKMLIGFNSQLKLISKSHDQLSTGFTNLLHLSINVKRVNVYYLEHNRVKI